MLKIICCIYSHQHAVFTSSLSQSSLTSVLACLTRFKSTLYNKDGPKTSTFLTNDSLSFLGKKTWNFEIPDRQLLYRSFLLTRSATMRIWVEKSLHEEEFNPERIFFLYSNMAAVTSCQNDLSSCVLLLVVRMSNRDCWFCHDALKLCWVLLLNILVQYASY